MKVKLNAFLKENRLYIIFAASYFVCFALLISQVPLSGDDWAWGSRLGVERLKSGFQGYNGRYMGNLVVLALTRSMVLRSVAVALVMTAICFLPMALSKRKSIFTLVFCGALMLATPKPVFVQGIFWTAGFANYIPPVLLIFTVFAMNRRVFDGEGVSHSVKKQVCHSVLFFVIAMLSALFVENVTITLLVLSSAMIAYTFVRLKRVYFTHLSFLAGGVVGTVLMFINSVYSELQEESDGYRSFPSQQSSLVDTIISHSQSVVSNLLIKGFVLSISISALCVILSLVFLKGQGENKKKILVKTSMWVNVACLTVFIVRRINPLWKLLFNWMGYGRLHAVVIICTALLYLACVFVILFVCVKNQSDLHKMLMLLVAAAFLVGPMLIIEPFGPRVLATPYACLALFAAMLFDYVIAEYGVGFKTGVSLMAGFILLSVASLTFYGCVYSQMKAYDVKRLDYIQRQLDAGCDTVVVCNLDNLDYLQCGNLTAPVWQTRYKLYHGIDTSVKFVVVSCEEFDLWCEEYDKNNK